MHCLKKSLLLVVALSGTGNCDGLLASRPKVTIASGVVVGTTTTIPHATSAVKKYIGIPFAKSPPERFSPPKPPSSWTKPLDAAETKPACIQQFSYPAKERRRQIRLFNNPGGPSPQESEDCLYLNVYTPAGTSSASKKPVMFWIYGGGLQFGTAGIPYYDGSSFATHQDVVVVTHNYRTNVFGFPNAPGLPLTKQNLGFLDQRAALAWVQENIAEFGGDPSKVTIFGESAGGFSVKQLVSIPPKPSMFRAAILESFGAGISGQGEVNFKRLASLLGCPRAPPSSSLACVQRKPAKKIKSIIEHKMLAFSPVEDGKTFVNDIRSPIANGTAAKVPILIGTNKDEGNVFVYTLGLDTPGVTFKSYLKRAFPGHRALKRKILSIFENSSQAPTKLISELITNSTFLCRASYVASFAQKHNYRIWRYRYDGVFPTLSSFPHAGAYHSSEVPEVFGTYPRHNKYGNATNQQRKLSKYMQRAWATFATHPSHGPGWPEYGHANLVAELGRGNSFGETTVRASHMDQDCFLYNGLIRESGV